MSWFLLAFISAMLSATAAISQKRILFTMDPLRFSLLVSFFGVIVSLPFLLYINFDNITYQAITALFIKSLLGAFAFYYVMQSIKNLELSGALPLMALTPGLIALFAFLILGEKLTVLEIAGIFLLASGTYVLEIKRKSGLMEPFSVFIKSKNHHFVIIALLLFTFTSILDKVILKNYKMQPEAFMLFQQIFFCFIFLVISFFNKDKAKTDKLVTREIILMIILTALITAGYRYTQILAVKLAPVAIVLAIKRTSVLYAVIIGGRIYHEQSLVKKTIATVIIIFGAILIAEE